ncbi:MULTISPECIES: HPP family protein [unclassified Bradyrhizobium]|uniref:HPP family protein n=1 Tax=unclassified Bradyrhizobium TaxID=2631580 RepID=UPI002013BE28|nr:MULTISPECIES: HPP family protein [unclassified Bradyrhizobium]
MPGATLRDRLIACAGALLAVGLTGAICTFGFGHGGGAPLLVASVGASAVLLFAVPASPLAQPWAIIGGNTLSAFVGIVVARLIGDPLLAAAVAAAFAIAAMSLARCLHPPGGAVALTAVFGGPAVASAGWLFPLVPVALNCAVLVALGWLFHRFTRHAYPHRASAVVHLHGIADRPTTLRSGFRSEDIDGALNDFGEAFDIDRADLDRLLRRVEQRALERRHGALVCADIMSRDVVVVGESAGPAAARALLIDHGMRSLPVLDRDERVVGIVGLRELSRPGARISDLMAPARTTQPQTPALRLLAPLTDGRTHAVIVVDEERRAIGVVTQTDLLAAMARAGLQAAVA